MVAQAQPAVPHSQVQVRQRSLDLFTDSKFIDYETQPGDTLHGLSQKFFGKPDYYLDIYLANQTTLDNPSTVPGGITLRIPVAN